MSLYIFSLERLVIKLYLKPYQASIFLVKFEGFKYEKFIWNPIKHQSSWRDVRVSNMRKTFGVKKVWQICSLINLFINTFVDLTNVR